MLSTDAVWYIDEAGNPLQATVATIIASGSALPFFASELDAATDAQTRFTNEAAALTAQASAATDLATSMGVLAGALSGGGGGGQHG